MQPLGVDEPTVVGPYRLLGRLGSGGMGRVYLGRSAGGRTVAVKIVHPHFALDEEFRARFRREVEAARRVGAAWTAPVLDADPEAPVPWVATAYAAGPSLSAAVADAGPLPAHSVRVLGAGLAEALAAVHELGLVHRDVKPSNVLLTLDGPLLIDFGIARATDGTASLTSTGVSIGSPGYMSPEQILGKGITGAADVFSLGAVLAYAATGEPPFPGDSSASLLYKVVHEEPELGSLDGGLRALVGECLSKSPGERPTPGDVARRLAPEGAARMVTGGWLPGALVEQVSRSAVRLLNLEVAGEVASGPVGFSRASVGEAAADTAGAASGAVTAGADVGAATVGEFGPPPVMSGGVSGAPPVLPGSHPSVGVPEPRGAQPEPRDAVPPGDARPGRLSVSVAATSAPGASGRGRRMSCTVALAVAGALAAVTVGSVFVFDLLPGGRNDDAGGSSDAYATPSTSATFSETVSSPPTADNSSAPEAPAQEVPDRYLGTWEGEGSGSGIPMGTFRLTVKEAAVGEELGKLKQTDIFGGVCNDVLTLKEVAKTELIVTSVGEKGNHAGCNPAPHTVRLTPVGDDLRYVSESSAEGNPEARMSKVK
ncbi:serine/threonine-protein kinase [Streptomyces sp. S.PB5]|uniref:serine/threonine-protein kinase n=1 Tax=Streptomyces sp. S.PB5 TaxID=3020844 RepID=UPI0025B16E1F|nr:serine/threonine-protein kinase [Streptomyces sp. S.PB5]MDN3024826.1 serine/threonine-protein kinase [Streptomyces sp. S.PB5]